MEDARINEIADALIASNGQDGAGASTGERIAAAIVAGRIDWAGYSPPGKGTDVIGAIQRLGSEGSMQAKRLFDER